MVGEKLAILDAGAQYGKVIDRRARELGVLSEIIPFDAPTRKLQEYKAFIISGGPDSVGSPTAPKYNPELFALGKPILGICYGMQVMNKVFGGEVGPGKKREDCETNIEINPSSPLFQNLSTNEQVLMSHGDSITRIAEGFEIIANSDSIPAAIQNKIRLMYGTQFHPEVDLTVNGKNMLKNFLFEIAGFKGDFTLDNRLDSTIKELQQTIKDNDVLVLVSGGVDSTICASLLGKATNPEKVHAIHIDNGFMRKNESAFVKKALQENGIDLQVIDAKEEFYEGTTIIEGKTYGPLKTIEVPEIKRKIIGDVFMQIAEREIKKLGLPQETTFLAQGTLRPDLIESASTLASSKADVIKTHHNDTTLVREKRRKGLVIEPNKDLHKDEVRAIGEMLGLPEELVWRQPFPGPGLAVRIICSKKPYITEEFSNIAEKLQQFANEEISIALLPMKSVGVQGDGRTYSYVAALSGTADWPKLKALANEIPKTIYDVNRVVFLFGEKVSGTVKTITPTLLTPDTIALLQEADAIAHDILHQHDLVKKIAQMPIVLAPISFDNSGNRSIVLRPFITNDFMTGTPALPGKDIPETCIQEMVTKIQAINGINRVMFDLTSKPPGTTEWE